MGASYIGDIKNILIEDLGQELPSVNSKKKERMGIFKCARCDNSIKTRFSVVRKKERHCLSCRGATHGEYKTRLYKSWANMKNRCTQPSHKSYVEYGGRGISICSEWIKSYEAFSTWAKANGYKDNLDIDRIDNDGNYSPENCQWVTKSINNKKTRLIHSTNTSGYRGVSYNNNAKKYQAYVNVDGKRKHLGFYELSLDAARVRDEYVISNNLAHTLNKLAKTWVKYG